MGYSLSLLPGNHDSVTLLDYLEASFHNMNVVNKKLEQREHHQRREAGYRRDGHLDQRSHRHQRRRHPTDLAVLEVWLVSTK